MSPLAYALPDRSVRCHKIDFNSSCLAPSFPHADRPSRRVHRKASTSASPVLNGSCASSSFESHNFKPNSTCYWPRFVGRRMEPLRVTARAGARLVAGHRRVGPRRRYPGEVACALSMSRFSPLRSETDEGMRHRRAGSALRDRLHPHLAAARFEVGDESMVVQRPSLFASAQPADGPTSAQ